VFILVALALIMTSVSVLSTASGTTGSLCVIMAETSSLTRPTTGFSTTSALSIATLSAVSVRGPHLVSLKSPEPGRPTSDSGCHFPKVKVMMEQTKVWAADHADLDGYSL